MLTATTQGPAKSKEEGILWPLEEDESYPAGHISH